MSANKMPLPYIIQPLKTKKSYQRFLGIVPAENAFFELNNLLAESKNVRDVNVEDVCKIADKYGINFHKNFAKALEGLYEDYLTYCLNDKSLSEDEISDLAHLKHILELEDGVVDKIQKDVVERICRDRVDDAIKDRRIDLAEREFLEKIVKDLKIDEEVARNICSETLSSYVKQTFKSVITDQRLSDDEEKELEYISKSLGVQLNFDEAAKRSIELCRLWWSIESGEIPTIEPGINLQPSEKCYCMRDVQWYENRTVTKRIRYSGPTLRVKILKGLNWRMGDLGIQRKTEDILLHIDTGRLYLTNKRLIFQGNRNNTSINLSKILDFTTYKDGIDIQKDSGKTPFIKFEDGVGLFSMILARAIRDLS